MSNRSIHDFSTLRTPEKGRGGHRMDFPMVRDSELPELAGVGIFLISFEKEHAGFAETDFKPGRHQALLDEVTGKVDSLVTEAFYHTYKPRGWQK